MIFFSDPRELDSSSLVFLTDPGKVELAEANVDVGFFFDIEP